VDRVRYSKAVTTFSTTVGQHLLAACVGHAGTKTVFADSPLVVGLIRPFHYLCLIGMKLVRYLYFAIFDLGPIGPRTLFHAQTNRPIGIDLAAFWLLEPGSTEFRVNRRPKTFRDLSPVN
jgi:hypothetical protein